MTFALFRPTVLIVGCLALPSCTDPIQLNVYSWWTATSEADAFREVAKIYQDAHPGVEVNNLVGSTSSDARNNMARDLLIQRPPSTFQANIGADLLRWTVADVADEGGTHHYLEPLNGQLSNLAELEDQLPNELKPFLSVNGTPEIYAVPINIHRLNYIYYNTERLNPDEITLAALCPTAPSPGLDAKFSMGMGDRFSLAHLAFENVLIGMQGSVFYERLFKGEVSTAEDWDKVRQALACVQHLSTLLVEKANKDSWLSSARRVALPSSDADAADFTIGGDWINGEIRDAIKAGTVAAMPFPVAAPPQVYVFTSDTFPLPVGAPHRSETLELLETMAGTHAQAAFSGVKGSIPARRDAVLADPSRVQTRSLAEFASSDFEKVVATSGLFPPYYPVDSLFDVVHAVMSPDTTQIDRAMTSLQAWEPLLGEWQKRIGPPP